MPTVAELERLQALVSRLIPLTTVQRGTLVRSDDWNLVVGAVIELARAVLAGDAAAMGADHEHADQVGLPWLDPRLRSLVERGPSGEPAVGVRLAGIESRLDRLDGGQRLATDELAAVRARVDEVTTRDLVRARDVTAVRRLVEGREDARDDIAALRGTLRGLEGELRRVVEVSQGLLVGGEPIDVGALAGRVAELEQLRERLRLPSGDILDAAALEARLTDLTATLVTEAELDDALATVRPGVDPAELAALEDRVRGAVTNDVNVHVDTVAGELRADVATRLADVDARVGTAVQDALPGVIDQAAAAVRPEIVTARQAAVEAANATADQKLATATDALRGELGSRVTGVEQSLAATVTAEVDRQLPAHLAAVSDGIERAHARLEALDSRLADHDRRLSDQGTRIEVVARDEAAARAQLDSDVRTLLAEQETSLLSRVDGRFAELEGALAGRVDERVDTAARAIEERAQKVATTAAAEEVRHAAVQLRAEMQQIARDEVAGLRDDLRGLVASEVKQHMSRVRDQLPELVRREFEEFQPTLRKIISEEVDRQLRERDQ